MDSETTPTEIPAMPVIKAGELFEGSPFVLGGAARHCVGWQRRAERKGGPSFVLIQRTALDNLKVLERFPLDEDGWKRAWRALVQLDVESAQVVFAALTERVNAGRAGVDLSELDALTLIVLRDVVFLGGYLEGKQFATGTPCDLRFLVDRLILSPPRGVQVVADAPYAEVEALDIGGPGLVQRGSGFAGGGFGLVGMAQGMAIAALLNALTTRHKIQTVVRVQGANYEFFLLYTELTPEQLRIELSQPLGTIRQAQSAMSRSGNIGSVSPQGTSVVEELNKLADLLERGLLTRDEFEQMKARILAD
jgi:hypothetical protein